MITADNAQPEPAVPRHGIRDLRVARRREGVEAVHAGPAHGPYRRPHRPSARARSDRRHARPQHLDPRRHLARSSSWTTTTTTRTRSFSTSGRRRRGSTTSRSRSRSAARRYFRGQNPDPGTAISYWLKKPASSVKISIRTSPAAKSARLTAEGRRHQPRTVGSARQPTGSRDTARGGAGRAGRRASKSARGGPSGTGTRGSAAGNSARPRRSGGARTTRVRSRTRGPTARRRRWSRSRQRRAPTAGRALPAEAERRWQDDRDEDGGHRGR